MACSRHFPCLVSSPRDPFCAGRCFLVTTSLRRSITGIASIPGDGGRGCHRSQQRLLDRGSLCDVPGRRLNDLRQRYRAVGGDIDGLAAQISATESALSELSSVLANPSSGLRRSPNASTSIQSCIAVCSATIVDVKEHIDQVGSDSGAITFAGRVTHLWSREVVQQYERRLSTQIQAMQFLLTVSAMQVTTAVYTVCSVHVQH